MCFSHSKDPCRFCSILSVSRWGTACQGLSGEPVLPWHPYQDVILYFILLYLLYLCLHYSCMRDCMSLSLQLCFWVCTVADCVSEHRVDIHLTDIGGDRSAVAYGNRLLTAKTWHQRKQVSQAWHGVLIRGLRDRLSTYRVIITPIMSTIIPDKGVERETKYTDWCWLGWNQSKAPKVMDEL